MKSISPRKEGNEGMSKIAPSKGNNYKSKPIMVKGDKIRGTGRLEDTTNNLSVCSLHKLKTKCFMERCEGSMSY